MVQQWLTSHSTHYRSFRRQFYGLHDPTNSIIALKNDGQSTRSRANPTRLSSLKGKEKDVSKKLILIHIEHHEDRRHRGAWKRAKLSKIKARYSKPTCKNCSYLCAPLYQYTILQHSDSFYLYSPSSRPTSHLRCGQLEVRVVCHAPSKNHIFISIMTCEER